MRGDAYRAFSNKVREFDPESLIKAVASVSRWRTMEPERFTRVYSRHLTNASHALPDFILSEIVKAAILIENRPYYRRDRQPTDRDIAYLQHLYLNVDTESQFEQLEDLEMFAFRLSALQFPSQGGIAQSIPRSLLLHSSHLTGKGNNFDAPARFQDALGIKLEDYIFLGASLAALALASTSGQLDINFLSRIDLPQYKGDTLQTFLHLVSTDFSAFQVAAKERCNALPGLEIYDYNPLIARPIVSLPSGGLTVPVPKLLIERVTSGVFYDLAQTYGSEFLIYLGYAFQNYVGMLFNGIRGLDVLSEAEYGPRSRRVLSPDWILVCERGSVLECKTKRLRLGSRLPELRENLVEDVRKGISTAVAQLAKGILDIRNGIVYPKLADVELMPLVATLDHAYLLNGNPVRRLVNADLEQMGVAPIDYQVASAEELEYLAAVHDAGKIMAILWEKYQSDSERENDLVTAIRARAELRLHPLLASTYRDFMDRMRNAQAQN